MFHMLLGYRTSSSWLYLLENVGMKFFLVGIYSVGISTTLRTYINFGEKSSVGPPEPRSPRRQPR